MKDGYATLSSMTEDITQSVTLNTINTYLLASGIKSDLITKGLKTMFTINQELKNKKQTNVYFFFIYIL